jgi:hypothetical protein
VFLCYKDQDTGSFARQLNDHLRALGLHTWFAPLQQRVNYPDDIRRGIRRARHYVVIYSQHTYGAPERADLPGTRFRMKDEGMTQEQELVALLGHLRETPDKFGKKLYLLDYGGPHPLPLDLEDKQWQRHDRDNLAKEHGIDDLSDEQMAVEVARQVKLMVQRASGRRG